ncbi:MAG: polysaccharide deacetylase family protein [Thermodesulfobacteriota bacterium]|nr:polysaccharide deacetylase family protein [Thermodesulfobacteriota bacterium]
MFYFRLPFYLYCLFVFAALLMVSCAGLSTRPEPQPFPSPPPEPQLQIQPEVTADARIFPDFVALIAQPGDTFSSLASKYLNDPSLDWFIAEFNEITFLSPGQELIIPLQIEEKGGLSLKGYQTIPVISYHKFSKDKSDALTVKESAFEEQMRFLKENGYRVITMDQFFDFLDFKRPLPKKSVVITIDDDWFSTYEIAFPVLKKYGYPATLFVYTDLIIPGGKTLSWDLLAEMSKKNMDIQCHTKSHRNLTKRNSQESFREYFEALKKEVAESAEIIRRQLNKDVKYLAYPYGDANHLVVSLLKKVGYRGAFTVERGSNPFFIDPYRINRSMIFGTFNLKDFENSLVTFSDKELR